MFSTQRYRRSRIELSICRSCQESRKWLVNHESALSNVVRLTCGCNRAQALPRDDKLDKTGTGSLA